MHRASCLIRPSSQNSNISYSPSLRSAKTNNSTESVHSSLRFHRTSCHLTPCHRTSCHRTSIHRTSSITKNKESFKNFLETGDWRATFPVLYALISDQKSSGYNQETEPEMPEPLPVESVKLRRKSLWRAQARSIMLVNKFSKHSG